MLHLSFEIIGFDSAAAFAYRTLCSIMNRDSVIIAPFNLVIAAIVIAHGGILVSNNIREFSRVGGLTIENWTELEGQ